MLEDITSSKGIMAALCSLIAVVVWAVKIVIPRWMAIYEKRSDAQIEAQKTHTEASIAAQKMTAEAVAQIPVSFKSFELVHLGAEKRITEEIHEAREKIMEEISERRYILLTEKIREKQASQPTLPGG